MAVDWALSQTPDVAGTVISALGTGRQMGAQDAQRRILQGYNTDRAGTLSQLMAINPDLALRLQDQNAQEKTNVLAGQAADRAQVQQGHQLIARALRLVQGHSTDPAERRSAMLHTIDQLQGTMDPAQLEQLRQEAQNFDYTDHSIDTYEATFGVQATPNRPFAAGGNVYLQTPDGSVKQIAEAPRSAPSGYQWAPDGRTLMAIPNGPADPAVIGQTTAARRQAVNANPAPSRARAGGGRRRGGGGGRGGGGAPSAPPPWTHDWSQ